MEHIGFIGFGSMGSMLAKGLIKSGKINQKQLYISRKNKEKLIDIKSLLPEANLLAEAKEIFSSCRIIFICTKQNVIKAILEEAKELIGPDHHIISLAGSLMLEDIERVVPCKLSKLTPTVLSEVGEGITLICHNGKVTDEEASYIENMLSSFTKVVRSREEDFGFAADLTSCGPGLIAAIMKELTEAALRRPGNFSKDEITAMVQETLYGTAKLMLEKNMDYNDVITRVATKGGITEEGVKVIEADMPQVYDRMLSEIKQKRKIAEESMKKQFNDSVTINTKI